MKDGEDIYLEEILRRTRLAGIAGMRRSRQKRSFAVLGTTGIGGEMKNF